MNIRGISAIFIFVFILSLIGSAYFVRSGTVWFDEGYSIFEAKRSFSPDEQGMTLLTPADVHPFGYYLVLHGWMGVFGSQEFQLRLLSVLFMAGSVIILYHLIRKFYVVEWELTFYLMVLFLMGSTSMLRYGTEIRMYAMGLFLCLVSFYCLVTFFEGWPNKIFYVVSTALLPYVHYYTAFFVMGELIYLFLFLGKRPFKDRLAVMWGFVFSVVLMIPAIIYFVLQRARIESLWLNGSTWTSIISTFHYAFFHSNTDVLSIVSSWLGLVFLLIVFGSILMYLQIIDSEEEKKLGRFLLIWFFLAIFLGMVINMLVMPVYHHRFFFFTSWIPFVLLARSIIYWLSGSLGIKSKGKVLFGAFTLVIVLIFMVFNVVQYNMTQSKELYVVSNALPEDNCGAVIHESPFSILAARYYAPQCNHLAYSDITRTQLNSAGGDVIPERMVLRNMWNLSFDPYYYYEVDGNLRSVDYGCAVVKVTDGLNLTKCVRMEKADQNTTMGIGINIG